MKILLVQTSFLGDTVLSTPLIQTLKNCYPEASLWMMTTPLAASLIRRDPLLAGVITFDKRRTDRGIRGLLRKAESLRSHNFDIVFSLHKSWRTSLLLYRAGIPRRVGFKEAKLSFLYTETVSRLKDAHDVLRNLSLLQNEPGVVSDELRLFAPEPQEAHFSVTSLVHDLKGYVVLFPGSVWLTKRWHEKGFRDLAEQLTQRGTPVVLLGSPDERKPCDRIASGLPVHNFCGQCSLDDTMLIVKHATQLVCNDSLALHLASAFKIPVATIFCATSPAFGFGPWKVPNAILEVQHLSCKPCRRHGSRTCPTGTELCRTGVTAGEVVTALENL